MKVKTPIRLQSKPVVINQNIDTTMSSYLANRQSLSTPQIMLQSGRIGKLNHIFLLKSLLSGP